MRFTSGTTGAAKGVALTHRDILERTRAANAGLKLTHEDKILWVLPMAYHFYVSIILYLEIGSTVIVSADFLAGSLIDTATKHAATFLYITPMHVRMMNGDTSGRALPPSLKRVMSVSAKLHPQSALDFLAKYKVPVAQGYGIIEVGLPIQNNDEAAEHPEAIGRPVDGFEAKIVDDQLHALPDGQTDHITSLPLRGEIDIVGAGDSVTANLTAALAAGATLREAIELANAAASIVIHQLGTTGTASVEQLHELLCGGA